MFRPFGSTSNTSNTNTVGTTTPFGTPQPTQASSSFAFGSAMPSAAPVFGSTFGAQPASASITGAFGQPSGFSSPRPRYTTTSDMENNVNITLHTITAMPAYMKLSLEELRLEDYLAGRKTGSGSVFGAVGQPVPSTTVKPFGTSTGIFGSNTTQQTAGTFGAGTGSVFGQIPQQSTTATSGGIFGAPAAPAQSTTGGFGLFGQQPPQQQQQQPTNTFGASNTFGQTSTGGLGVFGKPAGLLGSSTTTTGGLFGQSTAQPATPMVNPFGSGGTTGFGGFGSSSNAQPSPSGIFGKPASAGTFSFGQPTTVTGFGQQSAPTAAAATTTTANTAAGQTSGGLFGAPTTSVSSISQPFSFGTGTGAGNPIAAGSTGTGFGGLTAPAAAGTSAPTFNFGAPSQAIQQSTTAAPTTSLFSLPTSTSTTATAAAPAAGGLSFNFGQSQSQPQNQQPPATTLSSGFNFGTSSQPSAQAPTSFGGFNFGGTTSNAPPLPPNLFGTSSSLAQPPAAFPASAALAPPINLPLVSAEALSIKPPLPAALTTPQAAQPSTVIGKVPAGVTPRSPAHPTPRVSFRLQPPSEPQQSFATSSIGPITTAMGYVLPRKASSKKLVIQNTTKAPTTSSSRRLFGRVPSTDSLAALSTQSSTGERVFGNNNLPEITTIPHNDDNEKYMIPNETTLRKLPYAQLSTVHNFTVGERGVGQVRFLQPVDLTKITLSDIFDRIVVFEPRLITLYPDDEYTEEEKPPIGSGLNLPAEIRLERCWCVNKSDRTPIKDMGDSRLQAHIERLKSIPDTHFIDYLPETGTWIFKVDHF